MSDWEGRVADLWRRIGDHDEASFAREHEALLAEHPDEGALSAFERAARSDSFGHPDRAAPLYVAALEQGLSGERRRRAVIQQASSLRNLGRADEAVAMLSRELEGPPDALTGAVRGFLALALVDVGREREATAVALTALAAYLPRYNASLARYAKGLVNPDD